MLEGKKLVIDAKMVFPSANRIGDSLSAGTPAGVQESRDMRSGKSYEKIFYFIRSLSEEGQMQSLKSPSVWKRVQRCSGTKVT